ncbi:hypothetical protein GWI33_012375, partial [Rhynchophorus ferrugineus]
HRRGDVWSLRPPNAPEKASREFNGPIRGRLDVAFFPDDLKRGSVRSLSRIQLYG